MFFKSFYTRIIFILSIMSLTLFMILAYVNTVLFKNELLESFSRVEKPRIIKIFKELDERFSNEFTPDQVKAKIDSLFFEFNIDVFDRAGNWIAGSESYMNKDVVEKSNSKKLYEQIRFASFVKIYYNPNKDSEFHAIKIHLRFVDSPIFNQVFLNFLLSGVFVILVSALVGWRLVYYLNKRLDRLKKGVSKITNGEFDIKLEDKGSDEIAFLAKNFNHMSSEINKSLNLWMYYQKTSERTFYRLLKRI
ncbi:hypothetical protein B6I21_06340 [candidate division KSB1 bacterium 4572_119]|nr:MAG: hypothetical protein B6I21_06340 [candidate division KSB1 bacterium 4572_119]